MLERIEPISYETVKKILDIIPENYTKISVIAFENDHSDLENGIHIRINSIEISYDSREIFMEHLRTIRNPKRISFQPTDYTGSIVIECLGRTIAVSGRPPPLTYADFQRIGLEKSGRHEEVREISITW